MYIYVMILCASCLGLYITFYLLGLGSYTVATMPYSGLLADMTHPSLRGYCNMCVVLYYDAFMCVALCVCMPVCAYVFVCL